MGTIARVLDVGCRAIGRRRGSRFWPFCGRDARLLHASQIGRDRMHFYGVARAAWGAVCAHMLFQTVSYTVVCVVLRDRHVENDPFHPLHGVELSASSFGHAFAALDMLPSVVLELKGGF